MARISNATIALHAEIDLNELVRTLDFSEEQTIEAARLQPVLIYAAGVYRVQKMRRVKRLKAKLLLLHSDLAKKYRRELKELGQRVTDKEVEERIVRNTTHQELQAKVDEAEIHEEYAKHLLESYRAKGSSIKVISELVGAEVYVSRRMDGDETQISDIRKKLRERWPGRVSKEERREKRK